MYGTNVRYFSFQFHIEKKGKIARENKIPSDQAKTRPFNLPWIIRFERLRLQDGSIYLCVRARPEEDVVGPAIAVTKYRERSLHGDELAHSAEEHVLVEKSLQFRHYLLPSEVHMRG